MKTKTTNGSDQRTQSTTLIIDITPTWAGVAATIARLAVQGDDAMFEELLRMGRLADAANKRGEVLAVIVNEPEIGTWLEANHPKVLQQAEEALSWEEAAEDA